MMGTTQVMAGLMMSSLQVTKTTYSGLQEHRIMKYTATGHKAKAKEQMSTETTDLGHLCKSPGAQHAEGEEHKVETIVEHA
jgi:hypothetical protein